MTVQGRYPQKFATTFIEGFQDPRFASWARKIEVPPKLDSLSKREFRFLDEITLFSRVIGKAFRERLLLLFSSRGRLRPELLAIISIGLLPKRLRPKIVLYGEMFEPNSGIRHVLERLVMRLVDRVVDRYILFSNAELEVFPETWGATKEKIRVCNHFFYPPKNPTDSSREKALGKHIFAGGNSFRDYKALIQAAALMPEHVFEVCTTRISNNDHLPPNVKVSWPPLQEFLELIETAAVIVIPIQMGLRRTAGLLTCFESMWLGKATIVPKAMGLDDYIQNKVTGLLVEGTPESYVGAIRWILDPTNEKAVLEMGVQARKAITEIYTLERYNDGVLSVIDEVLMNDEN